MDVNGCYWMLMDVNKMWMDVNWVNAMGARRAKT